MESYSTIKFRLLGLLPLILFLARLRDLLDLGEPDHILWMCHLSNLVLALGLFLAWPLLVRVSIPWLTFGLPLWIWDMTQMGIGALTSFGTHIGGLAVGLFALSKMRSERRSWVYALVWYLIVQQVCRMIMPVELNVNWALVIGLITVTGILPVILYWLIIGQAPTVTVQEAAGLLSASESNTVLVDVRSAEVFRESHLVGASNWPFQSILWSGSSSGKKQPS